MKYFYVQSVNENTVTLASPRYNSDTFSISIKELDTFTQHNVVVEYNRLTKEISVKTIIDVVKVINSRLKLTSQPKLVEFSGWAGVIDLGKYVITSNVSYEISTDDTNSAVRVRLYISDIERDNCSLLSIDWGAIYIYIF